MSGARVVEFVTIKRNVPLAGRSYGHWWVEIDGKESYGWWPAHPLRLRDVLWGTAGTLNGQGTALGGTPCRDPHHGQHADYEFHPVLLIHAATDEDIRDGIRRYASGFLGGWRWSTRPTVNCRLFQLALMDAVGLVDGTGNYYTRGSGCPALAPLRRLKGRVTGRRSWPANLPRPGQRVTDLELAPSRRSGRSRGAAAVAGLVGALSLIGCSAGTVSSPDSSPDSTRTATSVAANATQAFAGGDLHSLVASPLQAGRLYIGGHQAVSTSADGGRTWSRVATLDNADAMGWALDPAVSWVSGHPGLMRSEDGGRTYRKANDGLPGTDVHAFGAAGRILYGAGPAVGVFASTDGGATYQVRSTAAGQGFFGRILLDPANPEHLVAADARQGPVTSRDGGRTWAPLRSGNPVTWVSSPDGLRTLIASGPGGSTRSRDGGATWETLSVPQGVSIVEADPITPGRLYAARLQGETGDIYVSTDDGATWSKPAGA